MSEARQTEIQETILDHVNRLGASDKVSATFTRAATTTAYTAGDVVGTDPATNITFSGLTAGPFIILGARLRKDVNAIPSGLSSFRLHLYTSAPTAITDNLAYNLIAADRAKYLGYIVISNAIDLGDTVWLQSDETNFSGEATTTSIIGVLQTVGAWTPAASTVYTISLDIASV